MMNWWLPNLINKSGIIVRMTQNVNDVLLATEENIEENELKKNDKDLWNEILKESNDKRQEIEDYQNLKHPKLAAPPRSVAIFFDNKSVDTFFLDLEVDYLNEKVFPVLNLCLMDMLKKIKEQEDHLFTEGDIYFDSLNFIAEYLWNMNPLHPNRQENWIDISNIPWR